ncbi:DNA polymerase [Paraclostridium bifermentans]|uniref:DNA polymerase n=1 Tax=Paraclostridium bifermentans TaxID=1490 RepID=UPI00359C2165
MKILSIDIETYCEKDLAKSSVYSYVEHESFEITLFAYAYDDEEVKIIDLKHGEKIPKSIEKDLYDENIIKSAFNANFERICLSKYFKKLIPPSNFRCTMVNAMYIGLPQSLDKVAKILNLENQKMSEGKKLIKIFSTNKYINERKDKLWEDFKNYCKKDVEVEKEIRKKLQNYQLPQIEQKLWEVDQNINDRGVLVDNELSKKCLIINDENNKILKHKLNGISNISNPKSVKAVKEYLKEKYNFTIESLNATNVEKILESDVHEDIKELLRIRKQICKTSLKKLDAIDNSKCFDNRIRGLFQFYGANRTGRWAGRLVQVHNLPQNRIENLHELRNLVKYEENNIATIEKKFGKVSEVLPQLITTIFIPKSNHKFIISDFSAIEARVIAWLSGETWRNEVFKSHGKIYEASAAIMFNIPIEEITKDSIYRQKGKIAELALGYQGGIGALKAMGADKMGLSDDDLKELVIGWRNNNKNIVRLWKVVEKSAIYAVENKTYVDLGKIKFIYEKGILFIKLPSGRSISYIRPIVRIDNYGKKLSYEGVNQSIKKWERIDTYGGKLVENIVQAIARDCLAYSMMNLEKNNLDIVMHIHDEVVVETENASVDKVKNIMEESISWAIGLYLKADAFECEYYKKG